MLITVPEAARRTGRNAETIRRWIRTGRLRSEKVGTQHLVREEDVAGLLDDRPLDLPEHWAKAGDVLMPSWERLVRDARQSH
ncbi:MAG TPA: helix-turn-helix domain-containing protein [Acidimicrobiales bacterium]|nr:helix-turn-helix domain-containing protein [Acidimicrobiales bacterium]